MIQNHIILRRCLKEIESRLNWINSNQWQQKHFESLSELIYEKTKVGLSPLTLKRLWGKIKYNSNPSSSTLNTLAAFLGYNNWIDYQSNQKGEAINLRFSYFKIER